MSGLQDIYDKMQISLNAVHGVTHVTARLNASAGTHGSLPTYFVEVTFHGAGDQQATMNVFFRNNHEAATRFAYGINAVVSSNA